MEVWATGDVGFQFTRANWNPTYCLEKSDGSVKLAIAMHRLRLDKDDAQVRLAEANGKLWKLLDK